MEYRDLVKDFAFRTRKNLDTMRGLQQAQPEAEVYEVTQLINSMLGLLVFPQQAFINRIPETPLKELAEQGWPVPNVVGNYPNVENLNKLVRYLRNGIAHFNLRFIPDSSGHIKGFQIWNTREKVTTWKAELTIQELEKISDKLIELLLED